MGMYMASSKTLELNARNPILNEIRKRAEDDDTDSTVRDLILLIFDTAMLSSGFSLANPNLFSSRIYRMIKLGLSLDDDEDVNISETSKLSSLDGLEEVD